MLLMHIWSTHSLMTTIWPYILTFHQSDPFYLVLPFYQALFIWHNHIVLSFHLYLLILISFHFIIDLFIFDLLIFSFQNYPFDYHLLVHFFSNFHLCLNLYLNYNQFYLFFFSCFYIYKLFRKKEIIFLSIYIVFALF